MIIKQLLKNKTDECFSQLVPVFNTQIKNISPHDEGVYQRALISQYHYIARPSSRIKKADLKDTFPSSSDEAESIKQSLEQTARKLGIKLLRCDVGYISDDLQPEQQYQTLRRLRSESISPPPTFPHPKRQCTSTVYSTPKSGLRTPPESGARASDYIHYVSVSDESPTSQTNRFGRFRPHESAGRQTVSRRLLQWPELVYRGYVF